MLIKSSSVQRRPVARFKHFGFSLIEMMVVVVIIGILAALSYPSLQKYVVRSRQVEAKTNLGSIHAAEKIYHAANQTYTTDIADLGIEIVAGTDSKYTYSITTKGGGFVAKATGNIDDDETVDTWTIDQDKKLTNTINDVAK